MKAAILRTEPDLPCRATRPILVLICELFPHRHKGTIPSFNDHPETTHEDVLRVLRRARELKQGAEAILLRAAKAPIPAE